MARSARGRRRGRPCSPSGAPRSGRSRPRGYALQAWTTLFSDLHRPGLYKRDRRACRGARGWLGLVTPTLGRLLVTTAEEVPPRRRPPEAIVHGGPQFVDLLAPDGQLLGPLVGLEPDALHVGLHLAVAVRADAAAWAVAKLLRTVHGTRHPGRVQHALTAHVTAPDRLLDDVLDRRQRSARPGHGYAGTAVRFFWIRSFAIRTAVDASAAYPSAPTASAYSCVTGAPPTITITWSRIPAFSSALIFALNIGIVVVRKAEKPTISGLTSCTFSTNVSGATLTPRS